jgi:phosphohistidine phosphatase SixA
MKVYIQRHCLTDEGEQMDAARTLNAIGEEQAHVMRKFLKAIGVKPDVIISSDFARAHDTAKIMQRGDTPLLTTAKLRPDGKADKAWTAILKLAGDAKTVLIVTHSPLIYPLTRAVAFCFDDSRTWVWTHGAICYCNPQNGPQFRWFVPPKLAAHVIEHDDPKELESPLGETARALYADGCIAIAENLRRAHKAAALDPLIEKLKAATRRRFRRQWTRVKMTMNNKLKPRWQGIAYGEVRSNLQHAIDIRDPRFAKVFLVSTAAARAAGETHVTEQLMSPNVTPNAREAKKPFSPPRSSDDIEDDLDDTTDRETGSKLSDAFAVAKPLGFAAVFQILRDQFAQYTDGIDGQVSRAETVAVTEISGAYHGGGASVASDSDSPVLKTWAAEDDACPSCQANADMGEIPSDAPFDSGDMEPPVHPNCRCSVDYRVADDDDEL